MASRIARAALGVVCGVALLAACGGEAPGASAGSPSGSAPSTAFATLTPVPFPDAPRSLTDVEQLMMFEPGPFSGDDFDEAKVLDAVVAMDPKNADEWEQAILSQVHGDYSSAVMQTIRFDPNIADPAAGPEEQPGTQPEPVGTNHFALVLDASGSMAERSGSGTRMDEAKQALNDFVGGLPGGSTVSLRVYGHKGSNSDADKAVSCAATDVIYNGDADPAEFAAALAPLRPTGWTPLSSSIQAVAADIPATATDSIAYVVTDGLETCDGDPVQAAGDLADSGIKPIVNVIGFEAGSADQQALRAIADAGGGTYTQASSASALRDYLGKERQRMMDAWNQWKDDELSRINDQGDRKLVEASTLGETIMSAASTEGEQAMAVTDALHDAGTLDYDTHSEVWNFFYERKSQLWNYGYDTKSANWNASYTEKTTNWNEVYDTATSRWSEYYSRLPR